MADPNVPYRGQSVTRAQLAENRAAGVKHCFACKLTKPFSCFSRDASRSDRLQPKCKSCIQAWKTQRPKNPRVLFTAEEKQEKARQFRLENKARLNEKSKKWLADNKERFAIYYKEWIKNNSERVSETRRKLRADKSTRTSQGEAAYRRAHKAESLAHVRARQLRKSRAIPLWADLQAIKDIYREARRITEETGIMHHVDHIFPLKSEFMCGLHCEANLQILTARENLRKNNKIPHENTSAKSKKS